MTTCSDPGFAVLKPSFRFGKQLNGNLFIKNSRGIIHTATGQNCNDQSLIFFFSQRERERGAECTSMLWKEEAKGRQGGGRVEEGG